MNDFVAYSNMIDIRHKYQYISQAYVADEMNNQP